MQLLSKLRQPLRFGQITLALFGIVVLVWMLDWTVGFQIPGRGLLTILLVIALFALVLQSLRPLAQRAMWRLRNRLLVTYLLFGAVPLVLIFVMLALAFWVLCGQIAANMVLEEFNTRTGLVYSAAHDLALNTLYGMSAGASTATAGEFAHDLRQRIPQLRTIVRAGSRITLSPSDGEIQDIPVWMTKGYQGFLAKGDEFMIAAFARAQTARGTIEVLAYVPIDGALLDSFSPDVGSVELLSPRIRPGASPNRTSRPAVISSARPLLKARGIWDQPLPWGSFLEARQLNGGTQSPLMTVTSRPSLIIGRVFRSLGTIAPFLGTALIVVGIIFLLLESVSLIWSLRLARTITGVVYDLYIGTKQVETGDFSHQIPIRSKDQLSGLAGSFNDMTGQIQLLVGKVKEKEKLQAELEIAHKVQSLLFPRNVPTLKTLELVGMCNPARIVSGDYYDFVPVNERWTALVIADISGK